MLQNCHMSCKCDESSILAEYTRQITPGQIFTDILLPQHEEEISDQAEIFQSGYVDNEGQEPGTSVTPKLVHYSAHILKDLC